MFGLGTTERERRPANDLVTARGKGYRGTGEEALADVFLSYARANAQQAAGIARLLRASGFSAWFDESLPAHRAYAEVIEEQLDSASAVLVLWSRDAAGSQWVRSEANRGRESGRLIQVRLDATRLPMPFDQIQCVDLLSRAIDANSPAWHSVLGSITELIGAPKASHSTHAIGARPAPTFTRRRLTIGGGAVAAVAIAGATYWNRHTDPPLSAEAQLLLQKGMDALQQNDTLEPLDAGSTLQAIALLEDATAAAPQTPVAWGALAMAYAARKRVAPLAERPGLDARSRSAATTALDLDSREARALGALRMLDPLYRNWLAAEQADRAAVDKNPRLPILLFIMADMLGQVGRWRDAATYSKRFDRRSFLIPGADRKLITDLWCSGDLMGADRALATAVRQWPNHPQIWRIRIGFLMYSGRPKEVLTLLRDTGDHPPELSVEFLAMIGATAEALVGERNPSQAVKQNLDFVNSQPLMALPVAQACAALEDTDTAFSLLRGYYFGEGEWSRLAPAGGDQDRVTNRLFQPPMARLWNDRRFDDLMRRIGLSDYWGKSGTHPDYRRRI